MKLRRLSALASLALDVLGRICAFYLAVLGALALFGLTGEPARVLAGAMTFLTLLGAGMDWYLERGEWLIYRWRHGRRYITPPDRYRR